MRSMPLSSGIASCLSQPSGAQIPERIGKVWTIYEIPFPSPTPENGKQPKNTCWMFGAIGPQNYSFADETQPAGGKKHSKMVNPILVLGTLLLSLGGGSAPPKSRGYELTGKAVLLFGQGPWLSLICTLFLH